MGVYTPAVRTNKKHQSLLALVQTSLCTAYRPAGKPPKRRNRCPDFALRAFTVPFLRRGFAPRSSVSAFADRVPYALFTSSIIMNLFAQFVNTFTQKTPFTFAKGAFCVFRGIIR